MARTTEKDKVRELQRTLYRAAKADPQRRFHALWDKVHRRDVLERAWGQVRRNRGAPGIDNRTIREVEQHGVDRLLAELAADLKDGSYRAQPARRVFIPKPGRKERRPLSIPTVRDRVVQTAAKIALEPIFEADFRECSFGFRPGRAPQDALQVLLDEYRRGRRWVVEADIASCFEAIPHDRLIEAIEERVSDRHLLKLLRALLRAGVMEQGAVRRSTTGTPQGGAISPLLANVYLHRLDRRWVTWKWGVLCRYADDLVVMCGSQGEAEDALEALRSILAEMGLELAKAKTRVVDMTDEAEGLDFLGFHHRRVAGRSPNVRHLRFLVRWPSRQAMQHARGRLRDLTQTRRRLLPPEQIVEEMNLFLRGWSGYFRYGHSHRQLRAITHYALGRLARFMAKRHDRSLAFGWRVVLSSPNRMGLISLNEEAVTPHPNWGWREGHTNAAR